MEKKYGSPEAFKKACLKAVPGDISIDEANLAIEKYQKEWDEAGEGKLIELYKQKLHKQKKV